MTRPNPPPTARRAGLDPYLLLTVAAALLYVWIFAGLAFDFHAGLRTHKSDLGQMDQAVWNTSRGRFVETIKDDFVTTRMTDHVEPFFVLISPVLWLWNDVRALLLLQALAAGAGALFVYALARLALERTFPPGHLARIWQRETVQRLTRPLALALALAYLLAPHLQAAILTEFHAIPLSVPLILWAFWAVERGKWTQASVAGLLVASVKEEAALLGAGLGVWLLWRAWLGRAELPPSEKRRAFWLGGGTVLLCLGWFYLATFVIVPAHALPVYGTAESSYFQRYGALGNSPLDILRSFFLRPGLVWQIATEPVRVQYLLRLLAAFGFASLLGAEVLLLCLPVLLANQLSAYPAQYYGEFHYSAPLLPYFAVAGIYGTARLWRLLLRLTARRSESFQHAPAAGAPLMAVVSLFTNAQTALRPLAALLLAGWLLAWGAVGYAERGRGPLGGRYDPTPVSAHDRLLATRFIGQIPPDAPLTATAAVHPHVSHRRYIYQFPWGLDAPVPAEWALLDVSGTTYMAPGDVKSTVDEMLAGEWGVVDGADGYLLLRRGAPQKTIPPEFYSFVLVSQPPLANRPESDGPLADMQLATRSPHAFGPLTFLGLDLLDWPLWRRTKISAFWRVEEGFSPGAAQPRLEVRQPDGGLVYSYAQISPAGLLWYPPERWQPGDVIRLETLWLFLPRHWAVAVSAGGPPALTDGFSRGADGTLTQLPPVSPAGGIDFGGLAGALGAEMTGTSGAFRQGERPVARLTGRLPAGPVAAGQWVDVWLEWQVDAPEIFREQAVFVHLRDDGGNVSQQDGPPRYFLPPESAPAGSPHRPDWRQLPLPPELPPGTYRVVVGLFDPASGARLSAFDGQGQPAGNELLLGSVTVGPPLLPDQTCALIPEACLSQVRSY